MVRLQVVRTFCLIAFIFFFMQDDINAQRWKLRRYEIGLGTGVTQVFGDIGGTADLNNWFGLKDIKIDETRLAFDGLIRYKITPDYSLKGNIIYALGNGTDAKSRNNRGRSFNTRILEVSGQFEYYLIGEEKRFKSAGMYNRRGMVNNYASFSAYTFLGVGGIYFNPRVSSTQPWVEGIDVISGYSKFAAVFPFGLGLKYIIDDRWLLNTELGYRFTTTDFIDGHTQALDSKHKDVYYFLTLSVSYRLKSSRRGFPVIFDRSYQRDKGTRLEKPKKPPRSKKEAID